MFLVIAKMPATTHATAQSVEAFIVEFSLARFTEPQQLVQPRSGTDRHRKAPEQVQFQTVHMPERTTSPPATVEPNAAIKTSPAKEAPEMTTPKPALSNVPASIAQKTVPISQISTRSHEESSGSKSTISSGQSSGSVHVMTLGDPGSPSFIHRETPIYPFIARKLGKEGKVLLRLVLDAQGQLQRIETVETNGFGFVEAASAAIKKSTFTPAVSNGRTVSSQVLVPIRFVLK